MHDSSGLPAWLMSEYRHFVEVVSREDFPCHFGTVAQLHGELRYSFVEGQDVSRVPATLEKFLELSKARPQAKHNLTLFFEPEREQKSFEYYRDRMWEILGFLHRHDRAAWPSSIPEDPDAPAWEFCFGGEPFFLFAGSPAYKRRKSRNYGNSFILLFQPKRVFQGLDNDSPAGIKARRAIRGRLQVWDSITQFHPDMHDFGQPVGSRWKQYMFSDDDTAAVGGCPFAQLPAGERERLANKPLIDVARSEPMETLGAATIERDGPTTLQDAVHQLLPDVGSVKVRRDPPGFEHPTHTHDVDEILLIISGAITFCVGPDSTTCGSGDRLLLPRGTQHSSAAGRDGCIYVIATR